MKPVFAAALLLLATACSSEEELVENGGVTREEALALDNAADMLDTSADSLTAIEAPIGNGEEAVDQNVVDANGV